jgi:hypothetical protein
VTYKVEPHRDASFLPLSALPEAVRLMEHIPSSLGSPEDVQDEVTVMAALIRGFATMEPDEALQSIGALSARCTELCIELHRVEGSDRRYRQMRTMQVQRLIDELERQTRLHSRLIEMRRQDLELGGGRR